MCKGGIPLEDWSGARATNELHQTMREFVEASNRSSRRMLQLTWAIVVMTVAMLSAVVVQIVLAFD
jgi:hypothetical protein